MVETIIVGLFAIYYAVRLIFSAKTPLEKTILYAAMMLFETLVFISISMRRL